MVCCAALRGAALSLGPLLCLPSAVPAAMAHPLPSTKLANQLCRWSDDCPETWGHDNHLCCASSNPPIRAVFSTTNCRWSDDYPKTWSLRTIPRWFQPCVDLCSTNSAGGRTTTRRRGSLRSTCPPTSSGCGRSSSSRWVPKVWANVCPCVISHRSAVGAAAGECPGAGVGPCLMRPRPAEGAAAGGRRHLRGRSACACFYSRLPVGCGALAIGACLGMPHRAPVTRPALAACSCAADHTPFSVLPPPAGRAWVV